ncbi:MAG: sigma 54-interacting transcriptional regulator, partial [Myxococcales bacterium]|nr:sigma 54-interacting transcriptional regulator [Myxococcales bacterium]
MPVIFISGAGAVDDRVTAFAVGGVDYVSKPFHVEEVLARVATHIALARLKRWLERDNAILEARVAERTAELERLTAHVQAENELLREEVREVQAFGAILGESAAMRAVLARVADVAATDAAVLILGETGAGKELIAREIHARSRRAKRALVRVNCASIPDALFESEFFGHARGAFTGAVRDRVGRFAAADGGTLFLDEVGEIRLDLQGKLLRVLQDGEFQKVGEERVRRADVRVIAATNRDLRAATADKTFREDLFYRLNVFPIYVPPL